MWKVMTSSIALLVFSIVLTSAAPKYPFQDPSLPWDKRVDDLVDRLTLDELVNHSMALYRRAPFGVPRLDIPAYQWITECLQGYANRNATAFPEALGLAATFRFLSLDNIVSI